MQQKDKANEFASVFERKAQGWNICVLSRKDIVFEAEGSTLGVRCEEADVLYPTFSVSSMNKGGLSVVHSSDGKSYVVDGPVPLPWDEKVHMLKERNGTCWWDADRRVPHHAVTERGIRKTIGGAPDAMEVDRVPD